MATETPIGQRLEAKLNYVLGGIAAIIALAIPVVVYVAQDWLSR